MLIAVRHAILFMSFFQTVACSGETIVLTERQGEFGTEGHPYYNNEKCRWRIEVEEGAVGRHIVIRLWFPSLSSMQPDWCIRPR